MFFLQPSCVVDYSSAEPFVIYRVKFQNTSERVSFWSFSGLNRLTISLSYSVLPMDIMDINLQYSY